MEGLACRVYQEILEVKEQLDPVVRQARQDYQGVVGLTETLEHLDLPAQLVLQVLLVQLALQDFSEARDSPEYQGHLAHLDSVDQVVSQVGQEKEDSVDQMVVLDLRVPLDLVVQTVSLLLKLTGVMHV